MPVKTRRIAILVAPFRDRTQGDERELAETKAALLQLGFVPIFLPDTLRDVLDDWDTDRREMALACSADFVQACARLKESVIVQVGERITEGMRSDIKAWREAGRKDGPLRDSVGCRSYADQGGGA